MQLGFIGVGNIGTPMCRHLVEAGHTVLVYDANPSNLARMVSLGAQAAASPKAVAQACPVVFSSLPGPREIELVALGANGIIEAARPGLIFVDLSTNSPAMAKRVCAALAERGVTMLDAPVSGGVAGAERASLAVMVGGDKQAFETCKPLLQHIGANVFHVGEIGSGCVAKLVNNMLAFVNAVAAYEGMLLGVKAGVEPQMIYDIVQNSSGASWAMRAFPQKIFAGDFSPGFMIDLAHKDLRLALELGDELSIPLMMGSVCMNFLREARANGRGMDDLCGLMRMLEERLDMQVRVTPPGTSA
ncbi:MAG: NAD(P)-dependent oxidoreductase [Candidatus Tectimicrobiota bacterium]